MTRAISTISGFIVAPPGFKAKRISTRTIEYATTQASPARAAKLRTKSRNEDPGAVIPDELSGGAGFDVAGAGTVLCACAYCTVHTAATGIAGCTGCGLGNCGTGDSGGTIAGQPAGYAGGPGESIMCGPACAYRISADSTGSKTGSRCYTRYRIISSCCTLGAVE